MSYGGYQGGGYQQGGYAPPPGGPPGGGYGGGQGGYAGQGGYGGQGGGYGGQGGYAGPPPNADPQLWQWFSAVDLDRSNHITASELQQALVNGDWTPFDIDTVKLLMSIFDTNRSGTIGFTEFSGLWKYIKDWQGVFRHFDADRSGSISGDELARAMSQFGMNLSPQILSLVQAKYAGAGAQPAPHGGGWGQQAPAQQQQSGITFDRFVRACVVVKTLTDSFRRLDTDNDGWVKMNYEQFADAILRAP